MRRAATTVLGATALALVMALLGGPASATTDVVGSTPHASSAVSAAVADEPPRASISGVARYRKTLTASPGRWGTPGLKFSYRWYRNGRPIMGAGSTSRTRTLNHLDVGARMSVQVVATRPGHPRVLGRVSAQTSTVRHLRDARRTVTYRVVRDGSQLDLATIRRAAETIYADARGWRKAGVRFQRVDRGGDFTLVFARADRLPRYSSVCSVRYSCRVGRNVVINEARWKNATQTWRKARRDIGSYRHMVVNHETGHWLGFGHSNCSGRGRPAPVMQQQSKGLQGCTPNPWPLDSEAQRLAR